MGGIFFFYFCQFKQNRPDKGRFVPTDVVFFRCRNKIRGIGFNKDTVHRDEMYKLAQIRTTPFDGNNAGDADIKAHIEILFQLIPIPAKTVYNPVSAFVKMCFKDLD